MKIDKNSLDFLYKCSKCKLEKPNREFNKANHSKAIRKFSGYCKSCTLLFVKEKGYSSKKNKRLRLEDPVLIVFRSCHSGAKSRELEFNITIEFVRDLFFKQCGRCYYTNRPLDTQLGSNNSLSLDRIDSSKGYSEENTVFCSWLVNRMKNDLSLTDLVSISKDIVDKFYNK